MSVSAAAERWSTRLQASARANHRDRRREPSGYWQDDCGARVCDGEIRIPPFHTTQPRFEFGVRTSDRGSLTMKPIPVMSYDGACSERPRHFDHKHVRMQNGSSERVVRGGWKDLAELTATRSGGDRCCPIQGVARYTGMAAWATRQIHGNGHGPACRANARTHASRRRRASCGRLRRTASWLTLSWPM